MKKEIHPQYNSEVAVTCACGAKHIIGSVKDEIKVEICSQCHPFYTGNEKVLDTAGRVEKFKNRMAAAVATPKKTTKKRDDKKEEAKKEEAKEEVVVAEVEETKVEVEEVATEVETTEEVAPTDSEEDSGEASTDTDEEDKKES